jgi:multidrug resistance efflux pump
MKAHHRIPRAALSFVGRFTVTILVVALAAVVATRLWHHYMDEPWTRDARVRADVVQVATDVSGLVTEVLVHDNQQVHKGDVLIRIDPARFHLALRHAEADVVKQKAAAEEAVRERDRYRALTRLSVSPEQLQQRTAVADELDAAYQQSLVNRDIAKLNLERSEVRAPVNGLVTNFGLRPGNFIDAGHPIFALIDSDSFYVDAYFEETKLPQIKVGDRTRVRLMGEDDTIDGHVHSIAGGVADRERQLSNDLLANVNPTFSWVRLAQRIPVRIALDHVPAGVRLATGRTATVEVMQQMAPTVDAAAGAKPASP